MRKTLALCVAVLVSGVAASAMAAPLAIYNPSNGNIRLKNDAGNLAAIFMKSAAGNAFKTDAGLYLDVGGGVVLDTADTPLGFTYLGLPNGEFNVGNVVVPQTPISDLSLGYYTSLTLPEQAGVVQLVPEPATLAVAGLGLVGLVATARRRRA